MVLERTALQGDISHNAPLNPRSDSVRVIADGCQRNTGARFRPLSAERMEQMEMAVRQLLPRIHVAGLRETPCNSIKHLYQRFILWCSLVSCVKKKLPGYKYIVHSGFWNGLMQIL